MNNIFVDDDDHAKDTLMAEQRIKECSEIRDAFILGSEDRRVGLKNNPFDEFKDNYKFMAYNNGYKKGKKL
mgnify:CR=1 FL=1